VHHAAHMTGALAGEAAKAPKALDVGD
jgi:hypothetical protein